MRRGAEGHKRDPGCQNRTIHLVVQVCVGRGDAVSAAALAVWVGRSAIAGASARFRNHAAALTFST
jgi:hypothetical protein